MKQLFNALKIFGIVFTITFLASCEKKYFVAPPPPDPDVEISYSNDMQPFFDAKCIGCHGGITPNLESPGSYDNIINGGYVDTNDPESSKLYEVLFGFMGAEVTQQQKDMTLLWIEQGAKDN